MSPHHKPKAFWRLARIWFRHVRIIVWLLILLLLVIVLYLHNIGLPGFMERMVVRSFAARGLALEFSRVHLVWFKSIEADRVRIQPEGGGWVPRIECSRLELNFDPVALLGLKLLPRDLAVEGGQLFLPYSLTNGLTSHLTATNLEALIHFESGQQWRLDTFHGNLAGCDLSVSGTIVNPSQIQDWRILQGHAEDRPQTAYDVWNTVSEIRNRIKFLTAPSLRMSFDVNGAAPEKLRLRLALKVDSADSPWGLLENPRVQVRLEPMEDGLRSEVELMIQADQISSRLGEGDDLALSTTFSCLAESGSLLAGRAAFSANRLDTMWAGAGDLDVSLEWRGDGTNLIPVDAMLNLKAGEFSTAQGLAEGVDLVLGLAPSRGDPRLILQLPPNLFADIDPFKLSAAVKVDRVDAALVAATNLALEAVWSAPRLDVNKLVVDWAGGRLDAGLDFDVISGELTVEATTSFDPQRLYAILPGEAVAWLEQFTWQNPPTAEGVVGITLPRWDSYQLLWPGDIRPSLYLDGHFDVGAGTFQRVPLSGASSHFTYSNMCWHLPDLIVSSPGGALHLEHRNNDRTHEFLWQMEGAIDPTPALALVPDDASEAREILGTLWFGGPPSVDLALSGSWANMESVEAWGTVRATNFAFRGCAFDDLDVRVGFTNLVLAASDLRLVAGDGTASIESLRFDFPKQLAFLSNGVSHIPPMTVATTIGPQVVEAIRAYQFLSPPSAHVDGVIPLKGVAGADMRFDLDGGPFRWQNFNLQEIRGRVLWREETVALADIHAEFYGGEAVGKAFFDFTGQKDADFWFSIEVEDADIQPLVLDVFQSTNQLEGALSGSLSVTQANTGDFDSWFGYGHARLDDGYIWSAPIFGIISPVLDLFLPGLGSSRAEEAAGRYEITNSVIRTEDLVIYTSNMRLLYAGAVDFRGNVDAVAEAEILRDALLVGELVSVVLTPLSKAMIVKITGTLAEPEARPLYLFPRVLLAPLNPVKMLRDMFAPPKPEYEELPAVPGSGAPPGEAVDDSQP